MYSSILSQPKTVGHRPPSDKIALGIGMKRSRTIVPTHLDVVALDVRPCSAQRFKLTQSTGFEMDIVYPCGGRGGRRKACYRGTDNSPGFDKSAPWLYSKAAPQSLPPSSRVEYHTSPNAFPQESRKRRFSTRTASPPSPSGFPISKTPPRQRHWDVRRLPTEGRSETPQHHILPRKNRRPFSSGTSVSQCDSAQFPLSSQTLNPERRCSSFIFPSPCPPSPLDQRKQSSRQRCLGHPEQQHPKPPLSSKVHSSGHRTETRYWEGNLRNEHPTTTSDLCSPRAFLHHYDRFRENRKEGFLLEPHCRHATDDDSNADVWDRRHCGDSNGNNKSRGLAEEAHEVSYRLCPETCRHDTHLFSYPRDTGGVGGRRDHSPYADSTQLLSTHSYWRPPPSNSSSKSRSSSTTSVPPRISSRTTLETKTQQNSRIRNGYCGSVFSQYWSKSPSRDTRHQKNRIKKCSDGTENDSMAWSIGDPGVVQHSYSYKAAYTDMHYESESSGWQTPIAPSRKPHRQRWRQRMPRHVPRIARGPSPSLRGPSLKTDRDGDASDHEEPQPKPHMTESFDGSRSNVQCLQQFPLSRSAATLSPSHQPHAKPLLASNQCASAVTTSMVQLESHEEALVNDKPGTAMSLPSVLPLESISERLVRGAEAAPTVLSLDNDDAVLTLQQDVGARCEEGERVVDANVMQPTVSHMEQQKEGRRSITVDTLSSDRVSSLKAENVRACVSGHVSCAGVGHVEKEEVKHDVVHVSTLDESTVCDRRRDTDDKITVLQRSTNDGTRQYAIEKDPYSLECVQNVSSHSASQNGAPCHVKRLCTSRAFFEKKRALIDSSRSAIIGNNNTQKSKRIIVDSDLSEDNNQNSKNAKRNRASDEHCERLDFERAETVFEDDVLESASVKPIHEDSRSDDAVSCDVQNSMIRANLTQLMAPARLKRRTLRVVDSASDDSSSSSSAAEEEEEEGLIMTDDDLVKLPLSTERRSQLQYPEAKVSVSAPLNFPVGPTTGSQLPVACGVSKDDVKLASEDSQKPGYDVLLTTDVVIPRKKSSLSISSKSDVISDVQDLNVTCLKKKRLKVGDSLFLKNNSFNKPVAQRRRASSCDQKRDSTKNSESAHGALAQGSVIQRKGKVKCANQLSFRPKGLPSVDACNFTSATEQTLRHSVLSLKQEEEAMVVKENVPVVMRSSDIPIPKCQGQRRKAYFSSVSSQSECKVTVDTKSSLSAESLVLPDLAQAAEKFREGKESDDMSCSTTSESGDDDVEGLIPPQTTSKFLVAGHNELSTSSSAVDIASTSGVSLSHDSAVAGGFLCDTDLSSKSRDSPSCHDNFLNQNVRDSASGPKQLLMASDVTTGLQPVPSEHEMQLASENSVLEEPKRKQRVGHFSRELCSLYEHLIDSGASRLLVEPSSEGRLRRKSIVTATSDKVLRLNSENQNSTTNSPRASGSPKRAVAREATDTASVVGSGLENSQTKGSHVKSSRKSCHEGMIVGSVAIPRRSVVAATSSSPPPLMLSSITEDTSVSNTVAHTVKKESSEMLAARQLDAEEESQQFIPVASKVETSDASRKTKTLRKKGKAVRNAKQEASDNRRCDYSHASPRSRSCSVIESHSIDVEDEPGFWDISQHPMSFDEEYLSRRFLALVTVPDSVQRLVPIFASTLS